MEKKTAPETNGEQKIVTRYDRKMEERRKQKEKDKRQEKLLRILACVIGVVLVAVIVISIARPIVAKQTAINGTYIEVGDHKVSRLEYDFYYNSVLGSNSYLLSYYGLDASADLSTQMISEDMSFKDLYDSMAVEQMQKVKAMADEAGKNNFSFDAETEYQEYMDNIETVVTEEGISVDEYYTNSFGTYATVSNIEPFVREGLLADAYYEELLEQNKPSDEEVQTYYEEHKLDYDQVDYRSYLFALDLDEEATEDEIADAMEQNKADAEAMVKSRKEGADFNELCLNYASEEAKENYEDAEKDYSLSKGRYHSSLAAVMADWLYDDGRKEGDIEVLEDADNNRYYVVEFISKYYDEENNSRISDTLASSAVNEVLEGWISESYEVVDTKGNLNYLTIGDEEESSGNEESSADDAAASEDNASDGGDDSASENGTE